MSDVTGSGRNAGRNQPRAKSKSSKSAARPGEEPTAVIGILINSASNLASPDRFGKADPLCIAQLVDRNGEVRTETKAIETRIIDETSEPLWQHRDVTNDYTLGDGLKFTVYDSTGKKSKQALGDVIVRADQFYPNGFDGDLKLEGAGKYVGQQIRSTLNVKIYTLREFTERREESDDDKDSLDIDIPTKFHDGVGKLDPFVEADARGELERAEKAAMAARAKGQNRDRPSLVLREMLDLGIDEASAKAVAHLFDPGNMWYVLRAVIKLQRFWRALSQNWLSKRNPVKLPPSTEDLPNSLPTALDDVPSGRVPPRGVITPSMRDTTWHSRLKASADAARSAGEYSASRRCAAQLQHLHQVGRFVAAARAAAVLSVHATLLDPHGSIPSQQAFNMKQEEQKDKLPRRITRDDPLWPHLRGRFDGDRIYVHDSIVVTIIGGDVSGKVDQETAWRIYQHDMSGLQAVADSLHMMDSLNPIAPPFGISVDYLGFRVLCRPQVLFVGSSPPELVIGPVPEAAKAHGGPGDFPETFRQAARIHRAEVSLLVNDWEEAHPDLRYDLERIAKSLRLEGLPIILDVSDLPDSCQSTALQRIDGLLHFRTCCELLPPEVLTDAGLSDPTRRLRREGLDALGAPPLPSTHRLSSTRPKDGAGHILGFSAYAKYELPRRFLERLEDVGLPVDSRGWTEALHAAGVNCRHIGWCASKASAGAAAALTREGLARSAKWIFRHILWKRSPWAVLKAPSAADQAMGAELVSATEVVKLFNLILGGGSDAYDFWNKRLVPETVRRFGIKATAVEKQRVFAGGLFQAMQHHLKVKFKYAANNKSLFNPGLPEPFVLDDLMAFKSMAGNTWFPHSQAVQARLAWLQQTHAGAALAIFGANSGISIGGQQRVPPIKLRCFVPETKVICARGPEWHLACSSPGKHSKDGRWDRAYEALNLRLSMSRAIGDPSAAVGAALQGIAVALLKLSKSAEPDPDKMVLQVPPTAAHVAELTGHYTLQQPQSAAYDEVRDHAKAQHALWAADAAHRLLFTQVSAWWSELAAVEAEWMLGRKVYAEARMSRMQKEWDRMASDQPLLQLRLHDTFARILATEANWKSCAHILDKCAHLSELAFGRQHPATISFYARLGDAWARSEDWLAAARAFREALALADARGDILASARIGYELANVLHKYGDVAAAKVHAERVVWTILPRLHAGDGSKGLMVTPGGAFALDALNLLGRIYEDIFLRANELHGTDRSTVGATGLSLREQREIAGRAISCFEALLRQMPMIVKSKHEQLSREGRIVQSILRLKTLTTGRAERSILEDAIEGLVVSSTLANDPKLAAMKGVRALQPAAQTRSIAKSALSTATTDLEERVDSLCEAVARDAAVNGMAPSAWFDVIVAHLSGGNYWGFTSMEDPMHKATLQMLDLCRHFIGDISTHF